MLVLVLVLDNARAKHELRNFCYVGLENDYFAIKMTLFGKK